MFSILKKHVKLAVRISTNARKNRVRELAVSSAIFLPIRRCSHRLTLSSAVVTTIPTSAGGSYMINVIKFGVVFFQTNKFLLTISFHDENRRDKDSG